MQKNREKRERERREEERKEKERERKMKEWREKMEIEKMQKEKERQEKEQKEREKREREEKERRGKKMMALKEKKGTNEMREERDGELLENEQNKKRKSEHLKGNHTTSIENNDSNGDSEKITALTPLNSNITPMTTGMTSFTPTYKPETVLMTSTKHPNGAYTEEVGRSKKVLGGDTTVNTDGDYKDEDHVGVADADADDVRVTEEAMGGVNRWDILGNNNGASLGSVFSTVCCAAATAILIYTVI
ncbi:DNA ligase 1-like [Haliotis rubra]|uniref:DNA ligase 1-like n=1 Tax=Haliotis rubra TaxID=36100 RepID=UPI001EE5B23A|nr:DNA ligase 1-like [Haliotis rubra]